MTAKLVQSILSTKMVLIVRNDLKMGKGKIASQCSHAAILCYQKSLQRNSNLLKKWIMCGQPKIVLKVDSLSEIEELQKKAEELDIVAEVVRDAGRTQVRRERFLLIRQTFHFHAFLAGARINYNSFRSWTAWK